MKYLIPFHDFLNESKLEDIYSKYYADIESDIFNQIISADPTSIVKNGEIAKMGGYSKWLLQLYKADTLKLEDLYKATGYLTTFDALKKRSRLSGKQADILSYKSLPDLFKVISEVGGTGKPTEDESYLINDQYFINNNQAEVYFEDADYLIVIPRTLEASQFYGKDTEWCTLKSNMFKKYTKKGDLYIIIDKHKLNSGDRKRKLQFHFEEYQFMDMDDRKLKPEDTTVFLQIFSAHSRSFILRYDAVGQFKRGRTWVKLNGKYGSIDLQGNEIAPLKYDFVGNFYEGMAVVKLNWKCGFVDRYGNEVVPLKYDLGFYFSKGRARVAIDWKYGFVDKHGNEVVPLKYDEVGDFVEGKSRVRLNGKYGFVDLQGNEVVPVKYEDAYNFREGRAYVMLNGKYGFVDLQGNEVITLKYDEVSDFHEGMACVRLNNKYGFVDVDGNEVIPLIYDYASGFKDGKSRIYLNSKWGFMDVKGNVLE
jgi:hypothetical protein